MVHHSVCCLLVASHLARLSRLCRGRPRPCSRRLPATGAVLFFSSTSLSRSLVSIRTYRYISISGLCIQETQRGSIRRSASVFRISDGVIFLCVPFSLLFFCSSVKTYTMTEMSPEQSRGQFHMHEECYCRCCCSVCCYYTAAVGAAAAILLVLVAVRHRVLDGQIYCWFVESYHSVFFLI